MIYKTTIYYLQSFRMISVITHRANLMFRHNHDLIKWQRIKTYAYKTFQKNDGTNSIQIDKIVKQISFVFNFGNFYYEYLSKEKQMIMSTDWRHTMTVYSTMYVNSYLKFW